MFDPPSSPDRRAPRKTRRELPRMTDVARWGVFAVWGLVVCPMCAACGSGAIRGEEEDADANIPTVVPPLLVDETAGKVVVAASDTDLQCPPDTSRSGSDEDEGQAWCALPNGTKHGPFVEVSVEGRLLTRGQYHQGERYGPWLAWHKSGRRWWMGWYRSGQRHGSWIEISESGNLVEMGQYRDGTRDGQWISHLADGTVDKTWQVGRLGAHVVWNDGMAYETLGPRAGMLAVDSTVGKPCEPLADAAEVRFGVGTLRLPSGWCKGQARGQPGGVIMADDGHRFAFDIGGADGPLAKPDYPTQFEWIRTEYLRGVPMHYGVTERKGARELLITIPYYALHNIWVSAKSAVSVERTLDIMRTFRLKVPGAEASPIDAVHGPTFSRVTPPSGVAISWELVDAPERRDALLETARAYAWPALKQIIRPARCSLKAAVADVKDINGNGKPDRLVYFDWRVPNDDVRRRACDASGEATDAPAWRGIVVILMARVGDEWRAVGPVASGGGSEQLDFLETVVKTVELTSGQIGLVIRKTIDIDQLDPEQRCVVSVVRHGQVARLATPAPPSLCDFVGWVEP